MSKVTANKGSGMPEWVVNVLSLNIYLVCKHIVVSYMLTCMNRNLIFILNSFYKVARLKSTANEIQFTGTCVMDIRGSLKYLNGTLLFKNKDRLSVESHA